MFGQRKITCKNADGDKIVLTEDGFNPFLLAIAQGLYDTKNTVARSKNTMIPGAEYQGTVMDERNIVMTLKDQEPFDEHRDLLDLVFSGAGILTVEDDSHKRQIEYYVESVEATATPSVRYTTISLLCPNPYFTDTNDTRIYIANIQPRFTFPHAFHEEAFSIINTSRIATVLNGTSESGIGLTIVITARGDVTNPKITKIQTQEHIYLGDTNNPFTLHTGETVVITTHVGRKNVTSEGVDINQYLTEDSAYFQLGKGENSFGYSADSGAEYMTIEIMYRFSYKRA